MNEGILFCSVIYQHLCHICQLNLVILFVPCDQVVDNIELWLLEILGCWMKFPYPPSLVPSTLENTKN